MKFISHRGNLRGSTPHRENSPSFICEAVDLGFDVEVDVWCFDSMLFLGHDEPTHKTTVEWLHNLPLWCHAKNEQAFHVLLKNDLHCFWHENDRFTLTSRGIPWCFPKNYQRTGVTVVLGSPLEESVFFDVYGICTDYPVLWKESKNQ